MDVLQMKRIMMFTWLDDEELDWLYKLAELEERKEEFEIEDILEGINLLREGMNGNDREKCEEILLGLYDEGLIRMEIEEKQEGWLLLSELSITRRGRKVLAEMRAILQDEKGELSEVCKKLDEDYRKLEEAIKKEEQREKRIDRLFNIGMTVGSTIGSTVLQLALTR